MYQTKRQKSSIFFIYFHLFLLFLCRKLLTMRYLRHSRQGPPARKSLTVRGLEVVHQQLVKCVGVKLRVLVVCTVGCASSAGFY